MTMLCPEDGFPLVLATAEGHAGHRCAQCQGLWLQAAMLAALATARGFDIEPLHAKLATLAKGDAVLPCPGGHRLARVEYRTLELDWCADCHGIWFDAGELRRLIDLHPDEGPSSSTGVAGYAGAELAATAILTALLS